MSIAALAAGTVRVSADCATIERPPLVVSGALCGTVSDRYGGRLSRSREVILRTLDGRVVATTVADSDGRFQFGPVLAGDYHVGAPGFIRQVRTVRLLKPSGIACTHRLEVQLEIGECLSNMSSGSGIRLRVAAETPVQLFVKGEEWDGEYTNQFDFIDADPGDYQAELREYHFVLRRARTR
jgi:hypothetical protein